MSKWQELEEILDGFYKIGKNNTKSLSSLIVVIKSLNTRVEMLERKVKELENKQ